MSTARLPGQDFDPRPTGLRRVGLPLPRFVTGWLRTVGVLSSGWLATTFPQVDDQVKCQSTRHEVRRRQGLSSRSPSLLGTGWSLKLNLPLQLNKEYLSTYPPASNYVLKKPPHYSVLTPSCSFALQCSTVSVIGVSWILTNNGHRSIISCFHFQHWLCTTGQRPYPAR